MKINLKNSLLFFAGFFVVLLIVGKLFGDIGFYSVLGCWFGYIFGKQLGFDKGKEIGRQEKDVEITESFERENRRIEHEKLIKKQKKAENNQTITILGQVIEKKHKPHLYEWAKSNPETLEAQLRSIADKWHGGSIGAAIGALESDMAHLG